MAIITKTFKIGLSADEMANIPHSDSDLTNDKYVAFTASQGLNNTQKANARANIGAGTSNFTGYDSGNKLSASYITGLSTVATTGSYSDLSGKPTNVSSFINDAGYITTSALSGYATENWVQNQGYITSYVNYYHTGNFYAGLKVGTGVGVNDIYVPYSSDSQLGVIKLVAGTNMSITYNNGEATLSATTSATSGWYKHTIKLKGYYNSTSQSVKNTITIIIISTNATATTSYTDIRNTLLRYNDWFGNVAGTIDHHQTIVGANTNTSYFKFWYINYSTGSIDYVYIPSFEAFVSDTVESL